jgi:hypothetical protein
MPINQPVYEPLSQPARAQLAQLAESLQLLESGEEVVEAARTRRMVECLQAGDAAGARGVLRKAGPVLP